MSTIHCYQLPPPLHGPPPPTRSPPLHGLLPPKPCTRTWFVLILEYDVAKLNERHPKGFRYNAELCLLTESRPSYKGRYKGYRLVYQQILIASLLHPKILGDLLKNATSRNYQITIKRLFSCAEELVQKIIIKSSVARHYGCKRARHCGLIANGRSEVNRDFSCGRNTNYCYAAIRAIEVICPQGALQSSYGVW